MLKADVSKTYIIDALRIHLKARNITYKELAHAIGLSEPSIKRLFSGGDCGLDRLEQICHFLHLEFADLFKTTPRKRKLITKQKRWNEQYALSCGLLKRKGLGFELRYYHRYLDSNKDLQLREKAIKIIESVVIQDD